MSENKLPTKSELMEELERDAEVIRKHFSNACVNVKVYEGRKKFTLRIDLDDCPDGDICGNEFEYRPLPTAPNENEPVIGVFYDNSGHRITDVFTSAGGFCVGSLCCYNRHGKMCFIDHWCSYRDRNYHSDGWDPKWEDEL